MWHAWEMRILVGKHDGKRPLGRPEQRLKDDIRMYPQEIE
jgi:hypothetical protein